MNRRRLAAAITIVAVALGAFAVGRSTENAGNDHATTRAAIPATDSADAGFARDMMNHHAQAVEMADIIRLRTDDQTLFLLATDIVLTQQNQIGQMRGWLDLWDLPLSSTDTPLTWTGHSMAEMAGMADMPGTATMPGMAERSDIDALETLPIEDAEISFLRLMFAHHVGGIGMADAAIERAATAQVVDLATAIAQGQTAELNALNDLLVARGAEVLPLPTGG